MHLHLHSTSRGSLSGDTPGAYIMYLLIQGHKFGQRYIRTKTGPWFILIHLLHSAPVLPMWILIIGSNRYGNPQPHLREPVLLPSNKKLYSSGLNFALPNWRWPIALHPLAWWRRSAISLTSQVWFIQLLRSISFLSPFFFGRFLVVEAWCLTHLSATCSGLIWE